MKFLVMQFSPSSCLEVTKTVLITLTSGVVVSFVILIFMCGLATVTYSVVSPNIIRVINQEE
jgi:hypothetical protein